MSKCYQLSDGECIALAEGMSDAQRLKLIEQIADRGASRAFALPAG